VEILWRELEIITLLEASSSRGDCVRLKLACGGGWQVYGVLGWLGTMLKGLKGLKGITYFQACATHIVVHIVVQIISIERGVCLKSCPTFYWL
jgi:hypothetical protein